MDNLSNIKWQPIKLPFFLAKGLSYFKEELNKNTQINDDAGYKRFLITLDTKFVTIIDKIIERNGLPHLCHMINGWGNFYYNGEFISDQIKEFVHQGKDKKYYISQCDPEGDFHPWQTFAYLAMAGVDKNLKIDNKYTITNLAKNSTILNNDKGTELGHLLYALNYFVKNDIENLVFDLKGKKGVQGI